LLVVSCFAKHESICLSDGCQWLGFLSPFSFREMRKAALMKLLRYKMFEQKTLSSS
jgi:hypothetical protein